MARPRETSDEAILEVAREAFLKEGAGASTIAMARRLGVSQPALFKRFGSKQALMVAALRVPEPAVFARIEAGPRPDEPLQAQLEEIGEALLRYLVEVVRAVAILRGAGLREGEIFEGERPWPRRLHDGMAAWFRAATHGQADGDALALAFVGALSQVRFMWSVAGEEVHGSEQESIAAVVAVICAAMAQAHGEAIA